MIGTISSPWGTASAPPGQKSFCTSMTIKTSLPPMVAPSFMIQDLSCIQDLVISFRRLQTAIKLSRKSFEFVGDLHWIGHGRIERTQGLRQSFKLAPGMTPNVVER